MKKRNEKKTVKPEPMFKPRGKAVKLPETEEKILKTIDWEETIRGALDIARRTSPLALALFKAEAVGRD